MSALCDRLSPCRIQTAHRVMMLVILALAMLGLAWERVPAEGGLGWDGLIYARMFQDFAGLSAYHAQRVLPALILATFFKAAGIVPDREAVVWAFALYNAVLLVLCGFIWKAVADAYRLGLVGRWIGFCGLFLSFQAAKMSLYNPVLTDVTALAFGLLLTLLYGVGRRGLLTVATMVGALAWPTIGICGALLILFPRSHHRVDAHSESAVPTRALIVLFATVSLLSVLGYTAAVVSTDDACMAVQRTIANGIGLVSRSASAAVMGSVALRGPCLSAQQFLTALPSVAGLGLALLVMVWPLLNLKRMASHLSRVRPAAIGCAAAALIIPFLIVRWLRDPLVPDPSSLSHIARILLFPAEGKFLMPLVGTFVYFGPLVLVALLLWRETSGAVRELGLGALLAIVLTLPFGLVGEARFLTASWPFMVLALSLMLDRKRLDRRFALAFVVLTLATSQFWLPLNVGPWNDRLFDDLFAFPKQMYFMHFGPWMNWTTFVVQSVGTAIGIAWLGTTLLPARDRPLSAGPPLS